MRLGASSRLILNACSAPMTRLGYSFGGGPGRNFRKGGAWKRQPRLALDYRESHILGSVRWRSSIETPPNGLMRTMQEGK
jgi:hypothetical protein